jgi:lipoprotein signal peptidase
VTTTREYFLAAALIAACGDLATKVLAVSMLSEKTVDLRFIELRLVHNEGVSFGLATALPWWALVLLTSAVVSPLASECGEVRSRTVS